MGRILGQEYVRSGGCWIGEDVGLDWEDAWFVAKDVGLVGEDVGLVGNDVGLV